MIPYNVNAPLWSDGAVKTRWIALPNRGTANNTNEQIGFSPDGEWSFPIGTVLVKHFELATDESHPERRKRLETRLLVRDINDGVYGLTYKWRPDNSDADLLTNKLTEEIAIKCGNGSTRMQTWYYPSRQDCLTCHTPHGSNNVNLLTTRTHQLGQECHMHMLWRHQTVAGFDIFTFNKGCVNCHALVHGSNHPSGKALTR